MRSLRFNLDSNEPVTLLFLGAHCDDIEIGCGGTLLRLSTEYHNALFVWVVFSSDDKRAGETCKCQEKLLELAPRKTLQIEKFRNGYFPYIGGEIKDCFEELKTKIQPDCIFTHYREDRHQDHRVISDLTWSTFRDHFILEYEIPKYDGDLSGPNCFVPLSRELVERKSDSILDSFESQTHRQWFGRETFSGLMRLRGIECNSESGYAEAFYCRKLII